jgi:hypothetical protein
VVKVLLENGAIKDSTNKEGKTPRDLAESKKHRKVVRELDRKDHTPITNKGSRWTSASAGDAMREKNEKYSITQIVWVTFPLPHWVKRLGGKHSLLVLCVKTPEGTRQFVLEKAETEDLDAFPNGIMLSNCKDLNTHKFSDTKGKVGKLFTKGPSDLVTVTLADAYRYAVDGSKQDDGHCDQGYQGGPYDLAKSNCHHMALHVLNYCCRSNARCKMSDMPNQTLLTFAPVANFFTNSGSTSGSPKSAGKSFTHMPIEQSGTYTLTNTDLQIANQCAMLSDWVSKGSNSSK